MKIEGVVISCYAFDVQLTRVCVASVRFWYPHLPIWLLKDRQYGDFNTREIEKYWHAQVYPGRQKNLGWGFGKLEVMTELPARRLLLLDSDIVFAGRVIDRLESLDEDLIVDKEDFDAAGVEEQFFRLERLRQVDPQFEFSGDAFNTGQIVATTGRMAKEDFDGLVDWQARTVTHPEVFQKGEQGLMNYIALRKVQQDKLSIRREPFMVWPGVVSITEHIQVKDLTPEGRHQELIHWAGLRWGKTLEEMPRSEILLHFEDMYYQRIPLGAWLKQWRLAKFRIQRSFTAPLKNIAKKSLSKLMLSLAGRYGRLLINCWIAAVLFVFLIVRVLGSHTARHIISLLVAH
jgi:hypothetical protein